MGGRTGRRSETPRRGEEGWGGWMVWARARVSGRGGKYGRLKYIVGRVVEEVRKAGESGWRGPERE